MHLSFSLRACRSLIAIGVAASVGCGGPATRRAPVPAAPLGVDGSTVAVLQDFSRELARVHARNPAVSLRFVRDPALPGEVVLIVEYPRASDDPAARDISCDVDQRNWTSGRAIRFQARSTHPTRLSVSFFDRNHVVYTARADLPDAAWHVIDIAFDQIRPNPYFQPPDAKTGNAIDVSDVPFIAFAPQSPDAGQLEVRKIVLRR